jgi:hypothetical protein
LATAWCELGSSLAAAASRSAVLQGARRTRFEMLKQAADDPAFLADIS